MANAHKEPDLLAKDKSTCDNDILGMQHFFANFTTTKLA
jgi:hypothetical protein